jgi:cytochrome c553
MLRHLQRQLQTMRPPALRSAAAQPAAKRARKSWRRTLQGGAAALLLQLAPWPLSAADLARGEEIVQGKCFICHGAEGESSSPVFPRLAGQNAAYVARQLADYRSGKRKSTTMQPMVEDLSPADFQALGAYFASRPTISHAVADPDLSLMGRFIYLRGNPYSGVAACSTCHGSHAQGSESLPRLAGQHAQYTENQLKLFNTRERTNDNAVMHGIASKLTELELKAVASYLSGLK